MTTESGRRNPRTARAPIRAHGPRPHVTTWPHAVNAALGLWLIASPSVLDHRSAPLEWSDRIAGILALVFSVAALTPRAAWAPWGTALTGLWLLLAPLVFWAPTAAVYIHDSACGSLLIAFALLVPGVPIDRAASGPVVPPGWSYGPSAAIQRAPIIVLAFAGALISGYLASYQLGHTASVWDPFFPDGTKRVLESDVSKAWPVSDAGLGAISYILEALTGFLGGARRWRTMPWLVIGFGILVVPLGVISIGLIILQPLAVGAWCTLCLVTAAAMLIMIAPAFDEVVATCQVLRASSRAGRPFWTTFWRGGEPESLEPPREEMPPAVRRGSILAELAHATGLDNVPWNLALSAAVGAWLMFAPAALGSSAAAADSDHLVGALVVTASVISWGEIARAARFANILFGIWLAAAPWFLSGATPAVAWNDLAAGIALVLLAIRRGRVHERFGSWDRCIV